MVEQIGFMRLLAPEGVGHFSRQSWLSHFHCLLHPNHIPIYLWPLPSFLHNLGEEVQEPFRTTRRQKSTWSGRDWGLIPGSRRSSGEGNVTPLQYSCLENPMDGGTL